MCSGQFHGKSWGILAILILLLEGCGHKGPLKLPEPQLQTPQTETASPRESDPHVPQVPSFQPVE